MRKIGIAAVAAAGIVLAAGTATYATGSHSGHGPAGPLLKQHQVSQQITVGQQKLKNTVIAAGFSGATLVAGSFTPIDAGETITCPTKGGGTCTLEADMSVQAQGTSTAPWAICFVVDGGTFATCPYYGNLDSSFFENGTQIESISGLALGAHTVQTQVYSSSGGTAYNYSLTYHAYKP